MKLRTCITLSLAMFCAAAFAREQADIHTTTYTTAKGGSVTVHWGQPAAKYYGPPPPFAQLDTHGKGYISDYEAEAYPPLANDFGYADSNRDGRISREEYARWASR
ncbi:MAG: EF-hand domain-containing protein [Rhodanobacter sp.]|nr:EF-hand domain-containing protein [Rhodanobacter sp.]